MTERISASQPEISIGSKRILSIDLMRGIVVFCMIFFQLLGHFDNLGVWSTIASHNVDKGIVILPGMTLADVIAPMFLFTIGLTYRLSFQKRMETHGKKSAYLHFIIRYLALTGIGSHIDSCDKIFSQSERIFPLMSVLIYISIALGVIYLIACIKPFHKYRKWVGKTFIASLCAAGFVTIILAMYDAVIIFTDSEELYMVYKYCNALQAVGGAGLIALIFINKKPYVRVIATVAIFAAFTAIHEIPGNMERIDAVTQGGFFGFFGWGLILMAGTIVADLYMKDRKSCKYVLISLPVFLVLAFLGYEFLEINKGSVSPGYVLVSSFFSAVGFMLAELLCRIKITPAPFIWWGRSPLLMYMLQFLLVDVTMAFWGNPEETPIWLALVIAAIIIAIMMVIAYLLNKRHKIVKI